MNTAIRHLTAIGLVVYILGVLNEQPWDPITVVKYLQTRRRAAQKLRNGVRPEDLTDDEARAINWTVRDATVHDVHRMRVVTWAQHLYKPRI